jgi:glycosyltransferase involved in cell wall biosynthesis
MTPQEQIAIIKNSGLFDIEWYLARNPDIALAKLEPIEHWFFNSTLEKRDPNFLFSIEYYLTCNGSVDFSKVNPLVHYTLYGEKEGRQPSVYFDPAWFRRQYMQPPESSSDTCLSIYLRHGHEPSFSPNEYFDTAFYLERNQDIRASGVRPYEHFITSGAFEGRDPSPNFSSSFYIRRHSLGSGVNPLWYHLAEGARLGFATCADQERSVYKEVAYFTSPGPHFRPEVEDLWDMDLPSSADVFAFYLPQFHSVEVNDRAWGTGFTEWTNVSRGIPRFKGHFQPRIPRDLGFYKRTDPGVMARQVELAKMAGLTGFAFYYYHFNQGRILEKPIELFLQSELDFKFFLIWANENWTKTWDGLEDDVILSQTYTRASFQAQVEDVARHMADPRYYRINGRPLFVVYRPGIIPEPKNYLTQFSRGIRKRIGVAPYVFMAQGFGDEDPRIFGLDGAIEFPPHKIGRNQRLIHNELNFLDPSYEGSVHDYDDFVDRSLAEQVVPFPLIKTVFPSWDNDARRPGRGMIVHGANPEKYGRWLAGCIDFARQNPIEGRSIVAINAWNEWCEGAYLEPDLHYGFAYLSETSRAIRAARKVPLRERILLVGHDAHPHGAQMLLLSVAKQLRRLGFRVAVLLLEGGPLEQDYRSVADVFLIAKASRALEDALSTDLKRWKIAITNTVVSGAVVPFLRKSGVRVISLVHEMRNLIYERGATSSCSNLALHSDAVVFPSASVAKVFKEIVGGADFRSEVVPQGVYNKPTAPISLRRAVDGRDPVIVNVGFADMRKGYDLFLAVAQHFDREGIPGRFVWVGNVQKGLEPWIGQDLPNFQRVPFRDDVYDILVTADVMFLSSREDPFPSVALEAWAVGVPVVTFTTSGGVADLIGVHPYLGATVPTLLAEGVCQALLEQIRGDDIDKKRSRMNLMIREFDFSVYVMRLLSLCGISQTLVSVVIPNYNYAAFLKDRVDTVLGQTFPPTQVLIMDDCSTDQSAEVISSVASTFMPWITVSYNDANSGSPFTQWSQAAALLAGEYLWIAEADDRAEPEFLADMVNFMKEYDCSLAFCDSMQIDKDGGRLGDSYKFYYDSVDADLFTTHFVMEGSEFLVRVLAQKNIILNVSAVVWRRTVLLDVLDALKDELRDFRVAGDWRTYAELASRPGTQIGYVKRSLNCHRRHPLSATHTQERDQQVDEIRRMHRTIRMLTKQRSQGAMIRFQDAYISELKKQFGLAGENI